MHRLLIDKKKFVLLLIDIWQVFALLIVLTHMANSLSYREMAMFSIIHWICNTILLALFDNLQFISIPNMFSFFSLIFHCGQLIKEGYNISGNVPLPFENYGDSYVIYKSFCFYIISMTIFFVFFNFFISQSDEEILGANHWKAKNNVEPLTYGKTLLCIGIIPRIYVDAISIIGALQGGYEGVYSMYIPQAVGSLAFFADAGLLFLLLAFKEESKRRILFIFVILYKCVVMTSGGRQDKVAFLLVWVYIYFYVLHKIDAKKTIALIIMAVLGFYFICAIGTVRSSSTSYGAGQVLSTLNSKNMNNVIGNSLGEFGSAFVTLETAVKYTPNSIGFGFGRSYLAGILSIIPLIVNQIPALSETVIFVHQLPERVYFAFGGSYLGELYYNFGWFGVFGSAVLAYYIAKIDNSITRDNKQDSVHMCWCAIVSISMIMYVRGYFTDMMQRLAWTYIAVYVISQIARHKSIENTIE